MHFGLIECAHKRHSNRNLDQCIPTAVKSVSLAIYGIQLQIRLFKGIIPEKNA